MSISLWTPRRDAPGSLLTAWSRLPSRSVSPNGLYVMNWYLAMAKSQELATVMTWAMRTASRISRVINPPSFPFSLSPCRGLPLPQPTALLDVPSCSSDGGRDYSHDNWHVRFRRWVRLHNNRWHGKYPHGSARSSQLLQKVPQYHQAKHVRTHKGHTLRHILLRANTVHSYSVMSISAHAAFIKACKFFNIEFRRAKALDNGEVDINDLKKRIDKNTILVRTSEHWRHPLVYSSRLSLPPQLVGSVPNYPNGAVDDIPSLAKLAKKHKIGLHVDCCLGGFVVAFAKDCGIKLPAFDFKLDGKDQWRLSWSWLAFFFLRCIFYKLWSPQVRARTERNICYHVQG